MKEEYRELLIGGDIVRCRGDEGEGWDGVFVRYLEEGSPRLGRFESVGDKRVPSVYMTERKNKSSYFNLWYVNLHDFILRNGVLVRP